MTEDVIEEDQEVETELVVTKHDLLHLLMDKVLLHTKEEKVVIQDETVNSLEDMEEIEVVVVKDRHIKGVMVGIVSQMSVTNAIKKVTLLVSVLKVVVMIEEEAHTNAEMVAVIHQEGRVIMTEDQQGMKIGEKMFNMINLGELDTTRFMVGLGLL